MTELLFDQYELIEELTRRGHVSTLKCRAADGDAVILKLFDAPGEADRLRLTNRGLALGKLKHPGLARARGVEDDGDHLALAYDWVGGETVASMIERGVRFTDAQLFECMRQVLEALHYAHEREPPVIHRDIKPQNIVWTGERFVLIDFDSAREVFADSGTASVVGTTGYAGPEQFVGSSEPRSDQYGLAATVLHMATHRHPTDFPLAGLRIDLSKTTLSIPMRRLLGRMLDPAVDGRFDSVEDALDAVATEDGLEPWEVAMEPVRQIDSVVDAERIDDELHITIASRSSQTAWIWYGTLAWFLGIGAYLAQMIPQFFEMIWAFIAVWPLTIISALFALYFGSRARQEYRSRDAATIVLGNDNWRLELPDKTLGGEAPMQVRSLGHSSSASTGGVTPISIREALAVKVDFEEHRFGDGLLPVEAEAVVDTIEAFHEQETTDEFVFSDFDVESQAAREQADEPHEARVSDR